MKLINHSWQGPLCASCTVSVLPATHRIEALNIYPVVVWEIPHSQIARWKCSRQSSLHKSSFLRNNSICPSQKWSQFKGIWAEFTLSDFKKKKNNFVSWAANYTPVATMKTLIGATANLLRLYENIFSFYVSRDHATHFK